MGTADIKKQRVLEKCLAKPSPMSPEAVTKKRGKISNVLKVTETLGLYLAPRLSSTYK